MSNIPGGSLVALCYTTTEVISYRISIIYVDYNIDLITDARLNKFIRYLVYTCGLKTLIALVVHYVYNPVEILIVAITDALYKCVDISLFERNSSTY